jgi:hypothetical protein
MAYDWRTATPGVFALHSDDCEAHIGRPCTCGPRGYRARAKDGETGMSVLSPVFATEAEALGWRREHESAFVPSDSVTPPAVPAPGSGPGPASNDLQLAVVIQDFLAAAEDARALDPYGRPYSPAALNELQWILSGQVANALGAMPVRAVRRRQLQALLDDLQRDGLAPERVPTVVDALSAFYDYAVDLRLIESNPVDTLPVPAVTPGMTAAMSAPANPGGAPPAEEQGKRSGVRVGADNVIPANLFLWGLNGLVILFLLIALVLVAESV